MSVGVGPLQRFVYMIYVVCSERVHGKKKSKFLSSRTSLLLLRASSVAVEAVLCLWNYRSGLGKAALAVKENTSACSSFRCMFDQ